MVMDYEALILMQAIQVKDKIRQAICAFAITRCLPNRRDLETDNNSQANFVKRTIVFCNAHKLIEKRYENDIILNNS